MNTTTTEKIQVRDLLAMLEGHDPRAYINVVDSTDRENSNTVAIISLVGHHNSQNLSLLVDKMEPDEEDLESANERGWESGREEMWSLVSNELDACSDLISLESIKLLTQRLEKRKAILK